MDINPANKFMVGMRRDVITSMILGREFTKDEALNLAAYLVVMSEMLPGDVTFDEVKSAIEAA